MALWKKWFQNSSSITSKIQSNTSEVKEVKKLRQYLLIMAVTYSFENLQVWQKAHAFVLFVYKVTRQFPTDEKYGLTSQFRRAAVSI